MNILFIGSKNVMEYVKHFKKQYNVTTYNSGLSKCTSYETLMLNSDIVNNQNIIVVLNSKFIPELEQYISDNTNIHSIFSIQPINISSNVLIKVYDKIRISAINNVFNPVTYNKHNNYTNNTNNGPLIKNTNKIEINENNDLITLINDTINNKNNTNKELINVNTNNSKSAINENKIINDKCKKHYNFKDAFREFCLNHMNYMRSLELPVIEYKSNLEAVLIEYRQLPHLEFLIRNCIHKLGQNWSHTIVCGNVNYDFMCDMVKRINRNIHVIKTDYDNLMPSEYSLFLSSTEFWNLFYGEKILIYQEDTCIFKSNIDEFLEWDYIGAPFLKKQNDTPNLVGNGGLSLRSKSTMLKVIDTINIFETEYNSSTKQYMTNSRSTVPPEDVYFSKNIQEKGLGKVADWDTAYKFSSESIVNENSFGGHGIWCRDYNVLNKMMNKIVKSFKVGNSFYNKLDHRGGWNLVKQSVSSYIYDNSELLLLDTIESYFMWDKKPAINNLWTGIIHLTPVTPHYMNDILNLNELFKNDNFVNSLPYCKKIFTLSPYITKFLTDKLNKMNTNIKVFTIKHPTDLNVELFDINKYNKNKNKKIIQIGQQLRKMSSIYLIKTSDEYKKIWLTGFKDINRINEMLTNELTHFNIEIDYNCVEQKYINDFNEYDTLLTENIVFIDLFDAGANNAVVECIARNTPIIVNKIEGVVDYLGNDYPLYFNTLDDIPSMLNNANIIKAFEYLKNMDKSFLNVDTFTKQLIHCL